MKSQRAAGGGKQYGVPMEWVCETPGESDKQVAEAVIPALKDKSIEV